MRTSASGREPSYALVFPQGSGLRMNYYKTGSIGLIGDRSLQFDRWHHVAMTWNGAAIAGYIEHRRRVDTGVALRHRASDEFLP